MKKLLLTFLILILTTSIGFCKITHTYDKYGNKTGSYKTNNSSVSSYDRYGNRTGSYKTNSSGRTTQYDKYGNKVGSFKTGSNGVTTSYDK